MEPHIVSAHDLQDGEGAHHVRLHERRRVVQRVVVLRLGGKVHDQVGARDEGVDEGHVGDAALHKGDLALEGGQRRAVAGEGESVQDGDLDVGAVRLRLVDEVGADETGSTGDEDALGEFPRSRAEHRLTGQVQAPHGWCLVGSRSREPRLAYR